MTSRGASSQGSSPRVTGGLRPAFFIRVQREGGGCWPDGGRHRVTNSRAFSGGRTASLIPSRIVSGARTATMQPSDGNGRPGPGAPFHHQRRGIPPGSAHCGTELENNADALGFGRVRSRPLRGAFPSSQPASSIRSRIDFPIPRPARLWGTRPIRPGRGAGEFRARATDPRHPGSPVS